MPLAIYAPRDVPRDGLRARVERKGVNWLPATSGRDAGEDESIARFVGCMHADASEDAYESTMVRGMLFGYTP